MDGLLVVVVIGATVLAGNLVSTRLRVAAPLVLLVLGAVLGLVPALRDVELPPETVLLLFLPVILFWESLTTPLRSLRRDFRGIAVVSTILVIATAFAAAGVAHGLGVPWPAALILGAAVAPPDATAVAALGRMLPRRLFYALKAESLTNDGTALVLYGIAVGVAVGDSYTPWQVTGLVALSYVGGVTAGAVVSGAHVLAARRLTDPVVINVALILVPFGAYLVAESIGASGVVAVVVAGLVVTYHVHRASTPSSRRQTEWVWPLGSYLLNGALFVLVGIEMVVIAREIDPAEVPRLVAMTVLVWVTTIVVRFSFQSLLVGLFAVLDRRSGQQGRLFSTRTRVVSAMAGFRGAVSLAIALSVPLSTNTGSPLPGRDDVVVVTAGVILLTLLVQGPLLPAVVRWARLRADESEDDELRLAEHAVVDASLAVFDAALAEDDLPADVRTRIHQTASNLRWDQDRGRAVDRAIPSEDDGTMHGVDETVRIHLSALVAARESLTRLRRDGTIDDVVARRVQTRLDVEELRLTGVEPLD